VLVFQDLHWSDPSTVDIIADLAADMPTPIVLVANYRPRFDGHLPGIREINLQALSPRQSRELMTSLLDGSDPPDELVDFIVARTDGNPFFLEEIMNSLIETRTLRTSDGSWEVAGSLIDADLPTSVRGVIAARIDRLDPGRRRVLREASVVGRDFLYDVIRQVATETDTLDPSLTELESADLIREYDDQSDLEYFFKHALTQDVAYEGLLKQDRTELHARAAAAIELQFAGRLEEVSETLAYHYAEGAVPHKAVHYLRAAGRKAMDRFALVEAETHFQAAHDLARTAEPGFETDRALVETILDWAILFYYRARLHHLRLLLDEHEDVVHRLDDDGLLVWWLVWRGHTVSFGLDQTDNLSDLDRALELAKRIGDDKAALYAETWKIYALYVRGRIAEAIEVGERIAPEARAVRQDDPYPFFKSQGVMALVLTAAGRFDAVEAICGEMLEFGRETGNNRSVAFGMGGLSFLAVMTLSYDTAIQIAHKASEIAIDPIYAETVNLNWAVAAVLAADDAEARLAVQTINRSLAKGISLPAPLFVRLVDGVAMLGEGDLTPGMNEIFAVEAEAEAASRVWEQLTAWLIVGVVYVRIATRDRSSGWKDLSKNPGFVKYLRRARKETRQRLQEAATRCEADGFNGLIPLITYHHAIYLIHKGDLDGARVHLETCRDLLENVGITEGTERVRALLATVAAD
jgi:tetratricopeptide (TPR) repeat protein